MFRDVSNKIITRFAIYVKTKYGCMVVIDATPIKKFEEKYLIVISGRGFTNFNVIVAITSNVKVITNF